MTLLVTITGCILFTLALDALRQRQWRRRHEALNEQLDAFTDASIGVAQAVTQLACTESAPDHDLRPVPRKQIFALAKRRLGAQEEATSVQQGLGLRAPEIALLVVAQTSAEGRAQTPEGLRQAV